MILGDTCKKQAPIQQLLFTTMLNEGRFTRGAKASH